MANLDHSSSDNHRETRQESFTGLQQVGAALQSARESQGLSLHQLAEGLHMGDEQLKALEAGDRANLAETVFVRATVRRVANRLRMDPEPLIAALRDLDGVSSDQGSKRSTARSNARSTPAQAPGQTGAKPNQSGRLIRIATVAVAVGAAVAAGWSWSQTTFRPQTLLPQRPQSASASIPSLQPTPPQLPASQGLEVTDQVSTTRGGNKSVIIFTKEPSWIAIRDRERQLLFEGMVDSQKTVDASNGIEIYAGRPDLVTVNDDSESQGPLGAIDQLRWYPITAAPSPSVPNPSLPATPANNPQGSTAQD